MANTTRESKKRVFTAIVYFLLAQLSGVNNHEALQKCILLVSPPHQTLLVPDGPQNLGKPDSLARASQAPCTGSGH
eukprot:1962974-Amphidinium_carterae.2